MNELGEGTKHDIQPATDDMTFERKSKEIVKLYKYVQLEYFTSSVALIS